MSSVNLDSDYHCGGWKIEQLGFWGKKNSFQAISTKKTSISTQENLMNTFMTPTNHSINSKYPKNGPKTQNQIGLVLVLKSHTWFFMQHWSSKEPPWSPSHLMEPVNTNKTYFGGRKWIDRWFSLSALKSSKPSLTNHFTSSKYHKMVQKPKIKSVYFWLSQLIFSFLCNIETLNNHHEAPLISWNPWSLIKPILVAEMKWSTTFS
jgi:hypothetical protein